MVYVYVCAVCGRQGDAGPRPSVPGTGAPREARLEHGEQAAPRSGDGRDMEVLDQCGEREGLRGAQGYRPSGVPPARPARGGANKRCRRARRAREGAGQQNGNSQSRRHLAANKPAHRHEQGAADKHDAGDRVLRRGAREHAVCATIYSLLHLYLYLYLYLYLFLLFTIYASIYYRHLYLYLLFTIYASHICFLLHFSYTEQSTGWTEFDCCGHYLKTRVQKFKRVPPGRSVPALKTQRYFTIHVAFAE